MRIFFSQYTGRVAFDAFDGSVYAELRIDIKEKMHMVRHHFHR